MSYSYSERQQTLVQLSTGRTKEVTSHAITGATGVETTETKRFNTSPKYNLPGQGEFGGPLLKGSVARESGSAKTTQDASPQAMTYAISDLPEDLSVAEIGLICVHDTFAFGRKGDRE